jgi:multiple sugar transport system substrate-binding protein
MSWPQAVAIFAQGNAALYTDASSIYANMLDPEKSAVADKTGVAKSSRLARLAPIMYNVTSWGLAMSFRFARTRRPPASSSSGRRAKRS